MPVLGQVGEHRLSMHTYPAMVNNLGGVAGELATAWGHRRCSQGFIFLPIRAGPIGAAPPPGLRRKAKMAGRALLRPPWLSVSSSAASPPRATGWPIPPRCSIRRCWLPAALEGWLVRPWL